MGHSLYLLRHGQARPALGHGVKDDHARPLSPAGNSEIARLGERLAAGACFQFGQVLVSSATRTMETARGLGLRDYVGRDDLYNADMDELLGAIRKLDACVSSAIVIAHNPGISWLAASLIQPQDCAGFLPGTFIELGLPEPWSECAAGKARLIRRLNPPDYHN